ncbi:MAG: L-asparaginase [Rhodobacterales bacterium]|nr:MAG: L-asparaginase [Rhodobacterales bacterium]
MNGPIPMIEVWRGDFLESFHCGHAVVCDAAGQIVQSWGNPDQVILPRSSAKMIQALPLIESGAAKRAGLTSQHLALACASHNGADIHTQAVAEWLQSLGLSEQDLRCGAHNPKDKQAHYRLIRAHDAPCQLHNNCSGKHAGFLTLSQHLGGGPEYNEADHPVQIAVREAFEDVTGQPSPGFGIDGCSAPNFATTVHGFARAMGYFAGADAESTDPRKRAAAQLVQAMCRHPELVAGEKRACTELVRAMGGRVAVKTGAEAVFAAIIPELKLGVAVKISDGGTRAAEAAIAAILVKLGVLEADHPATRKRLNAPIKNWNGVTTGYIRAVEGVF